MNIELRQKIIKLLDENNKIINEQMVESTDAAWTALLAATDQSCITTHAQYYAMYLPFVLAWPFS